MVYSEGGLIRLLGFVIEVIWILFIVVKWWGVN